MKDLIEAVLQSISKYIPLLVSVIANPRTTVPRLVHERDDPLRHALIFCGISIAITFVAQAPLLTAGQDFTTSAGALFMVKLFEVLVFNAILLMVFKLVGGTGTFEHTLSVSLYISGPIYLFVIFAQIIGLGLIASRDTELAFNWRYGVLDTTSSQWTAFVNAYPGASLGLTALALVTLGVVIGWYIYCWRIYRDLHGLTRWRSVLAYILAFVFFCGVAYLRSLIIRGLSAGTVLGLN